MKIFLALLFTTSITFTSAQEHITVLFAFDKSSLNSTAQRSLDSLVRQVKVSSSRIQLKITGHTDAIGAGSYNDRLSAKRIASVKKYLRSHGIPGENLMPEEAFGERKPLNTNSNPEERSFNRRVEIEVFKEDQNTNPNSSLKEKIADSSTVAGTNIILKNINFYGGMHQFLPESQPRLQELLDAMKSFPKLVIRIEGHICCHNGPGDGRDIETGIENLSEARAKAIRDYLVSSGIEPARVTYKGFGHSAPIYPYPEKTEEEMTENRRVEIKIVKK
jgi:outer membrane protein OmpA-like peptidoglycan-associated protein